MKELIRTVELPKFSHRDAAAMYPGYSSIGPSHGWHYPIAETKTVIFEYGINELVKAVQSHLEGNGIPEPENLIRLMHEYLCERLPQNCVEMNPARERIVSLWQLARRFYRAVKSAAINGLVSQEEAERRAVICSTCPNNRGIEIATCQGCYTARFVTEAATALSTKHTSLDGQLDTCSLCQCRLSLKIFVPVSGMQEKGIEWPSHCWMRE